MSTITVNGVIFTTASDGSGTGTINTFVQIDGNPADTEQGYNTDGTRQFDEGSSSVFNHSITLAQIPVVIIEGTAYREFRLDLNESNNAGAPPLSLDSLKIFAAGVGNLTGFNPSTDTFSTGSSTLLYNLDSGGNTSVALSDWGTGSGHGDYVVDIPDAYFANLPGTTNIYLYSAFGDQAGQEANAGFEEWYVVSPPVAPVTANPSITIDKQVSVDGGAHWFDQGVDVHQDPTLLGSAGSALQYRFIVTNTGNVDLNDVTLTDSPVIAGLLSNLGTLHPSESVTIDVAGTFAAGDNVDTATVSGTTNDSVTVSASDTAEYHGATPGVTLDKQISGNGTDWTDVGGNMTAPVILVGNTVYFQALVGNTDTRLDVTGASVTDVNPVANFTGPGTIAAGSTPTDNVYTLSTVAVAGLQTDTANFTGTATDSAGHTSSWTAHDSANYYGATAGVTVDKQVSVDGGLTWQDLGSAHNNPATLVGADVQFRVVVKNTSDGGLAEDVTVLDVNPAGTFDFGPTHLTTVHLASGETQTSNVLHTSALLGGGTDTANATGDVHDDFGHTEHPTATDTAEYKGLGIADAGLSKGYWATHLTPWDVVTSDSSGSDLDPAPQYNWNGAGGITSSAVVTSGPSSGKGAVSGANNGGGDSGLLMGDLNHDGLLTSDGGAHHLYFDLASAQTIANSSVSGDARVILAGQAVAAQLNEYQDYVKYGVDTSPNGLIDAAVRWLSGDTTYGLSANGHSNVNTITANDVGGVPTVINDGTTATNDYTISGGAITLKGTALSSTDASWLTKAQVFSENGLVDINGNGQTDDTVWANGEGLKNALAAYDHGLSGTTGGYVTSTDGTLIGWQDSLNGTPYDVHANGPDVFWGILANHAIVGVEWHV